MNDYREKLGPPDLSFHTLQIWIHGRQFPELNDFWDGNWVRATVHCGAKGGDVWTSGSIIHLPELKSWLQQTETLNKRFKGNANLDCMEPYLSVEMEIGKRGEVSGCIRITPDIILQKHEFKFEVDQSYLPPLIKQLKEILVRYPIKDE